MTDTNVEYQTINYTVENRVATIALNQPKSLNAVSQAMRHELLAAINEANSNDDVRVVVLRAEGKGFTSGTDLSEGLAGFETIEDQIREEYKPILMTIAEAPKPYIASIHGACAGIGAAIALSCDLAVMSDDAYLFIPFSGLSFVPDGGMSHFLVNAMGYKRAYQAFLEAGKLPAQECLDYGIINKIFALEDLVASTQAWAEKISKGAPLAQQYGKQILRGVHTASYEETVDLEAKLQVTCSSSEDAMAAMTAFFSKTTPEFKGK
jgi:2-(1,2-epoxy-1,2-dihydrophenyl)acetyl-CoA isomerase